MTSSDSELSILEDDEILVEFGDSSDDATHLEEEPRNKEGGLFVASEPTYFSSDPRTAFRRSVIKDSQIKDMRPIFLVILMP